MCSESTKMKNMVPNSAAARRISRPETMDTAAASSAIPTK
jgi:hypothetical protein